MKAKLKDFYGWDSEYYNYDLTIGEFKSHLGLNFETKVDYDAISFKNGMLAFESENFQSQSVELKAAIREKFLKPNFYPTFEEAITRKNNIFVLTIVDEMQKRERSVVVMLDSSKKEYLTKNDISFWTLKFRTISYFYTETYYNIDYSVPKNNGGYFSEDLTTDNNGYVYDFDFLSDETLDNYLSYNPDIYYKLQLGTNRGDQECYFEIFTLGKCEMSLVNFTYSTPNTTHYKFKINDDYNVSEDEYVYVSSFPGFETIKTISEKQLENNSYKVPNIGTNIEGFVDYSNNPYFEIVPDIIPNKEQPLIQGYDNENYVLWIKGSPKVKVVKYEFFKHP